MEDLFFATFLISILALGVGMIFPGLVLWGERRTRLRVVKVYGLVFFASVVAGAATSDRQPRERLDSEPAGLVKASPRVVPAAHVLDRTDDHLPIVGEPDPPRSKPAAVPPITEVTPASEPCEIVRDFPSRPPRGSATCAFYDYLDGWRRQDWDSMVDSSQEDWGDTARDFEASYGSRELRMGVKIKFPSPMGPCSK